MEIDFHLLAQLSIADLCALKDKASINLSIASFQQNPEMVDEWTIIMSTCLAEVNRRKDLIFKKP